MEGKEQSKFAVLDGLRQRGSQGEKKERPMPFFTAQPGDDLYKEACVMLSGGCVATLGINGAVKILDITKKEFREIQEDNNVIALAAWSNGQLITGDKKGFIKIWEMRKKDPVTTFQIHEGSSCITALIELPNNLLAISLKDQNFKNTINARIEIWDMENKKCITTLQEKYGANVLAVSNGLLAVGTDDRWINIWDLKTYELVKTVEAYDGLDAWGSCVTTLIFFSDKHWLATGSDGGSIRVWKLNEGNYSCVRFYKEGKFALPTPQTLGKAEPSVTALAALPNNLLARGLQCGNISIWSEDGNLVYEIENAHTYEVKALGSLPDGDLMSCGRSDGMIKCWSSSLWLGKKLSSDEEKDSGEVEELAPSGNFLSL